MYVFYLINNNCVWGFMVKIFVVFVKVESLVFLFLLGIWLLFVFLVLSNLIIFLLNKNG